MVLKIWHDGMTEPDFRVQVGDMETRRGRVNCALDVQVANSNWCWCGVDAECEE